MIIKLINCEVTPCKEGLFSKAQQGWGAISKCSGFKAQLGGWEQRNSGWEHCCNLDDQESIDIFMNEVHDLVVEENSQNDTYTQCRVSYFYVEMSIAINQSNARLEQNMALAAAGFIRITDCQLHPDGQYQFLKEQSNIWDPLSPMPAVC